MDGFRQGFKDKMECEDGEDHNPSSKRAKHVRDYNRPYDFDRLKPPLHEFIPDNRKRAAGSLASYVGKRINSAGREVDFSEDVKRPQATWP